jgi:hypothetical protein
MFNALKSRNDRRDGRPRVEPQPLSFRLILSVPGNGMFQVKTYLNFRQPMSGYVRLCQPMSTTPPPPSFFREHPRIIWWRAGYYPSKPFKAVQGYSKAFQKKKIVYFSKSPPSRPMALCVATRRKLSLGRCRLPIRPISNLPARLCASATLWQNFVPLCLGSSNLCFTNH